MACDQAQSDSLLLLVHVGLHRCLRTRASNQAPCCNEMPVIKVSQSRLEELINFVRQCPEIYDATHPDHKDALQRANIWASITKKLVTDNPLMTGKWLQSNYYI